MSNKKESFKVIDREIIKEKIEEQMPDKCPFIASCKLDMFYLDYYSHCVDSFWVYCECEDVLNYVKKNKLKHIPSEWKEIETAIAVAEEL